MADPISITASLLTISATAFESARSLRETVKRYKGRDKTLGRLQGEVNDLTGILATLREAEDGGESLLELLRGPVERCAQVCHDFELSMKAFDGKSKTSFRDWAKMEFMRGDINDFIDTITGYKATISVGLGVITMHTSKVSHRVLLQYNEMISDTVYNLEVNLQRIDEKMTKLTQEHGEVTSITVGLRDEKEVTRQCLHVCEEAGSYLHNLSIRASPLLQKMPENGSSEQRYEAQIRMHQTLDETRSNFTNTLQHLSRRLESLAQDSGLDSDRERSRLQADIESSKQCLEVCNVASDVSRQKVYKIGEVVADGDSDQVVVTTLADLFDIGKAVSRDRSAQLVGSMSGESLRHLTDERYKSRFGVLVSKPSSAEVKSTASQSPGQQSKDELSPHSSVDREQPIRLKPGQRKPSSNEIRKRMPEGDEG